MRFNVGDVFVFSGFIYSNKEEFQDEIGRKQTIIEITELDYISEFQDNGIKNNFGLSSPYVGMCIIVDGDDPVEYDNGVPMLWEDEL
jgi:hypothetical protein